MRFIYHILVNAIAIKVASYYIPGFNFSGDLVSLAWVALIITIVNFFLKPILKLITIPIIFLTFGLFTIVINMAILYIADYFVTDLTINGITALFWATIVFGIVNIVFSIFKK